MTKTTILTLAAVAFVSLSGALLGACDNDDIITVDPRDQRCSVSDDCVMTMVKCSCDCGVPINKEYDSKYFKEVEEMCKDYEGPMCSMDCDTTIECKDNVCSVKDEQTGDVP
ncbi:MAG: hypothetical protein MUC50_04940 [Myxococcota bacterium]|jgi:hypothetical protein|nr:hypothetical protein [Myxococcota bacterium]